MVFFFFQAEDGIRDYKVTGVQTCALPICHEHALGAACSRPRPNPAAPSACSWPPKPWRTCGRSFARRRREIGRASCRERVKISVVAVSLKKKIQKIKARGPIQKSEQPKCS